MPPTDALPPDAPRLTFVARLEVDITRPLMIGQMQAGLREVIPISGGKLAGPLLNGTVLPGGADWCLTRADGTAAVWARYTLALDDGTLVMVTNSGLALPQADGTYTGHTVPQFEVGPGPMSGSAIA